MDLYLDINGVLLDRANKPAPHLKEFIAWATKNFTCLWLTTHCRGGENRASEVIGPLVDARTRLHLGKILPTDWSSLKTEAIFWDRDFLWIDDTLMDGERRELERRGKMDSFVQVDLDKDPDFLRTFMESNQKL